MSSIRKILVAVNFTPAADAAFHYAAFLARHLGAGMTLLHVVADDRAPVPLPFAASSVRRPSRPRVARAAVEPLGPIDDHLTQLLTRIPEDEAMRARVRVVPGPVVDTVAKFAQRDFDVLVIGANSAGGDHLGATAKQIVRATPCRCVPIWPNLEGEAVAFAVRPRVDVREQRAS